MALTMPRSFARPALAALALAGALVAAPAASAATATTSFLVTLTVLNECVVLATPMVFGSIGVVGNPGAATSVLTVTCTAGTPFSIALDAGTAPDATIEARRLRNADGSSSVAYTLYQDASYTALWGNTVATTRAGLTATGLPQPFTVYGRILAGQATAAPGAYTDTIGVVVTY